MSILVHIVAWLVVLCAFNAVVANFVHDPIRSDASYRDVFLGFWAVEAMIAGLLGALALVAWAITVIAS